MVKRFPLNDYRLVTSSFVFLLAPRRSSFYRPRIRLSISLALALSLSLSLRVDAPRGPYSGLVDVSRGGGHESAKDRADPSESQQQPQSRVADRRPLAGDERGRASRRR